MIAKKPLCRGLVVVDKFEQQVCSYIENAYVTGDLVCPVICRIRNQVVTGFYLQIWL